MRDILQEAFVALRHNRRRSLLTMLGMAWGIATVVLLMAYGNGFGQASATLLGLSLLQQCLRLSRGHLA